MNKKTLRLAKKIIYNASMYLVAFLLLLQIFVPVSHAQIPTLSIQNAVVTVDKNNARVTWETNFKATGRVDFGIDESYEFYIVSGDPDTQYHTIQLSNLLSDTTYHFQITSQYNGQKNQTFDRVFKTQKVITDHDAPLISAVQIAYVTGTSATIQWKTDEDASSFVRYGKSNNYTNTASAGGRSKIHDITLGGLALATTYHFQIQSVDKDGNKSLYSDLTFQTSYSKSGDQEDLRLFNVKPITPNDSDLKETTAVVSWNTNKAASGFVQYGTSTKLGSRTYQTSPFRNFEHSVSLINLKPDTTYYFKITSRDVFGKTLTSDYYSMRTKPLFTSNSKDVIVVKTPAPKQPQQKTPVVVKIPLVVQKKPVVAGYTFLPYTPASLYRVAESKQLYAVFKDQKYLVSDQKQFLSRYGYSEKDIQTTTQAVMDRLPLIRLVKAPDGQVVYQLFHQKYRSFKLAIPSTSVFSSYSRNSWNGVITMDFVDIDTIPDATLVQASGTGEVYRLEQNIRRSISSEATFNKFGFIWSDVVSISQSHLRTYSAGTPVS